MKVDYRIDEGTALLMKGFAWSVYGFNFVLEIVTDWIGIGLFLSPVFMIMSYLALAFWIKSTGVPLLGSKAGRGFVIGGIISAIPVINLFYFKMGKSGMPSPGIVGVTSKIISESQEEDLAAAQSGGASDDDAYERESNRPNDRDSHRYVDETEENQVEDDSDDQEMAA